MDDGKDATCTLPYHYIQNRRTATAHYSMSSIAPDHSVSNKRRKLPPLRIRLCLSTQARQKYYQQRLLSPRAFQPGDRVYYRSKSANSVAGTCGTVVAAVPQNATNGDNNDKRIKNGRACTAVHFDTASKDSEPRQVSTNRLLPIYCSNNKNTNLSSSPHEIAIFVTNETNQFRQLAVSQIQGTAAAATSSTSSASASTGARVLEIGCSTGETSVILWRQQQQQHHDGTCCAISSWVGLDTSADMIDIVQKKILGSVPPLSSSDDDALKKQRLCQRVDALVDPVAAAQAACTFHCHGPTVVFVDIGGNRDEVGVLRMLQFLLSTAPFPYLSQIVIKSRALCQSLVDNNSTFFQAHTGGHDDGDDGLVIERADAWLEEQLGRLSTSLLPSLPRHPQKAPMRYCPAANDDNKMTPICRYHNYHKNGCHKKDCCPFDHVYCHFCLQPGHKALGCAHAVQHPASSNATQQRVDNSCD
jgi:SAM-dependent methyltransferase